MALLEGSEGWTEPAQATPFFPTVRMSHCVPVLKPAPAAAGTRTS